MSNPLKHSGYISLDTVLASPQEQAHLVPNFFALFTTTSTCYHIFLVLNFNDGRLIEAETLRQVLDDLETYSGGSTSSPVCLGRWPDDDVLYQDLVVCIEVIVPTSKETHQSMIAWAERTRKLLQQEEIYFVAKPVWERKPVTITANHLDQDQVPVVLGD